MAIYTSEEIQQWDSVSERHLTGLLREVNEVFPNDKTIKVLDIGSNIGKFIEMLERTYTVEDVIMVEPVIELLNYSKNKFLRFKSLNALVSSKDAPVYLYIPESDNLGISKGLSDYNPSIKDDIRDVPMLTPSQILFDIFPDFKPDLIKIDAEGMDLDIVEGLVEYIITSTIKPVIIFECAAYTDISNIEDIYTKLGYTLYSKHSKEYSRDVFLLPGI